MVGLVIYGILYSIFANFTINSNNSYDPKLSLYGFEDVDQWWLYAAVIKNAYLNNPAGYNSFIVTYWHAFVPLYPASVAIVDFIFNNFVISTIVLNSILSIGTLFNLKKIITELCDFQEKDAKLILVLYQSNFVVSIDMIMLNLSMPWITFSLTLAFYANIKFLDHVDLKTGTMVFLTNTLVLMCREIIWPFVLLCPALLLVKSVQKKKNGEHLGFSMFMKTELKVSYFTTLLPAIFYLSFLFLMNNYQTVFIAFELLKEWPPLRTVPGSLLFAFFAFSFMPFFIFFDAKNIYHKKENLPLIVWIVIFVIIRFVMPGPFWAAYWEPIIFCVCILGFQWLKNGRFKTKANLILIILILTNLVFSLYLYLIRFILPFND